MAPTRQLSLSVGLAVAGFVSLGATAGCSVPDTLGLVCAEHAHCNPGQRCGAAGVCEMGRPMMMPPPPTSGPDLSTGPSATTSVTTATASGPGSSGSGVGEDTTGPSCGPAVGMCDAIDVLFVLDNSDSMEEEFAQLIPAFTNFAALGELFFEGACSYRVGITRTKSDPSYQPIACQVRGSLNQSGALAQGEPCFSEGHPPWVSETDPLSGIGCPIVVGTGDVPDERIMDTLFAALSPELLGAGGCNEGFLREQAALIVILVTDEDDDDDSEDSTPVVDRTGSAGSPGDWYDNLVAIKPAERVGLLVIAKNGVRGGNQDACPWTTGFGGADGSGAEFASNLLTFAQYFTGNGLADHVKVVDICQGAAQLESAVESARDMVLALCEDTNASL